MKITEKAGKESLVDDAVIKDTDPLVFTSVVVPHN